MRRSVITPAGNRVIGIRHVLKQLKDRAQVDRDTLYPDDAADDIDRRLIQKAMIWYKIGAVRGALVALEEVRKGTISLQGNVLATKLSKLPWQKKSLNVKIGKRKIRVDLDKFRLGLVDDLGFSK
jgi:hypothetical protein